MVVCRSIFQEYNSAPAKGVFFKSHEVSDLIPVRVHDVGHFILKSWCSLTGNYYSFMNQHQKEARLFFTQGCVPGEGESTPQAESKGAVQESEFEAESGPSTAPTAKRGRPKGKQKAAK